jgi:hypothetical protein
VVYEVDRSWSKTAHCAWELIDILRVDDWDNPGSWTLSKVALRALADSARMNPDIRHALSRTLGTVVRR